MSAETNLMLDDATVSMLQNLVQMNLDSRDGFREVASNVSDQPIAELFQDIARERETHAAELSSILSASGQQPANSGSIMAAAHRAWMDLRAVLGGGAHAMLSEAERGEEYLKSTYEEALRSSSHYSVTEILQRHYAAIKQTTDALQFMREDRVI